MATDERYERRVKAMLDQLKLGRVQLLHDGNAAAKGYRPDRVYRRNKEIWVLELESSTNRKGFIGGYLKAQKYLHEVHDWCGSILFIINENKRNLEAVGRQIQEYHVWLRENGIPVCVTHLMSDAHLAQLVAQQAPPFSKVFVKGAVTIA